MTETRTLWKRLGIGPLQGPHLPMEQQAITWCLTHGSTGRATSPLGEACHYSALRQCSGLNVPPIGICEFSDGGPAHRWWVDADA